MTNYECADCGNLVKYHQKKCVHCWSELTWNESVETDNSKPKEKNTFAIWCAAIIIFFIVVGFFSSSDTSTSVSTIKNYSSLSQAYSEHKNFLRSVCKSAVDRARWVSSWIEWPTYAWEYMGEFIIKWWYGGSIENQFSCVFKKANNEWGMDIVDVR